MTLIEKIKEAEREMAYNRLLLELKIMNIEKAVELEKGMKK